VRVSSRAFGRDWRYPITSAYWAPPARSVEPRALRLRAEVVLEDPRRVRGEGVHPHPPVRLDHELAALLALRPAREMLDRVLRTPRGRDVRAPLAVVAGDVILVLGEPVAQEDHARARVLRILAVRKA